MEKDLIFDQITSKLAFSIYDQKYKFMEGSRG